MRFHLSLALMVAAPLFRQSLNCEVASIKPSEVTAQGAGMTTNGTAVIIDKFATQRFVIHARLPVGATQQQVPEMLPTEN